MIRIHRWMAIIPLSIILIIFAYMLGQLNGLRAGLEVLREINSDIESNGESK